MELKKIWYGQLRPHDERFSVWLKINGWKRVRYSIYKHKESGEEACHSELILNYSKETADSIPEAMAKIEYNFSKFSLWTERLALYCTMLFIIIIIILCAILFG